MMKKIAILVLFSAILMADGYYYYQGVKKINLTKDDSVIAEGVDFYRDDNGKLIGVNDEIIIKAKKSKLESIANRYGLTIIKKLYGDYYLLKTPSKEETLKIASSLGEEGVDAHPNIVKILKKNK